MNETVAKGSDVNKPKKHHTKNVVQQRAAIIKSIAAMDGIDHINIDNNYGKTDLGKLLANFTRTPFVHPEYGPFASIEGFWHWIRSSEPQDELRGMYGDRARAFGRKLNNGVYLENFQEEIVKAIYYKIVQNQNIYDLMVASTLPFKYYYIFGPKQIEICPDYSKWLCSGMEQIRTHLKQHGKDVPFQYKE